MYYCRLTLARGDVSSYSGARSSFSATRRSSVNGGMASAGFVSASALRMACCPALAGLLQTNFKIYNLTFNQETLPGWIMAVAWLMYLIWLSISFVEPAREPEEVHNAQESNSADQDGNMEKGLTKQLLLAQEETDHQDDEDDCDGSEESAEVSRKPANAFVAAYKLLTSSVRVQLLIYFMLKYAIEILLSESCVVTTYYFGWSMSSVSIFLFCLGLTVLPVNLVVGSYISNMFEDRDYGLCWNTSQLPCSNPLHCEVLEGVNLSLLSRVMSSRLSRGTYNGGLLSTEAGTIAHVIADATITVAGFLEQSMLLNVTMLPSLIISIGSIVATCFTFNSMY